MRSMRRLVVSAAASLGLIAGIVPASAGTLGPVAPLAKTAPSNVVQTDYYCGPGWYLDRWGNCRPYYYGYGWYGYGFPYYRYRHYHYGHGHYRYRSYRYNNFEFHGGRGHGHHHGGHGDHHGHGHGGHGHGGHGHGGHGHGH